MFVCRVSKIGRGCKIVTTACLFGCFFFVYQYVSILNFSARDDFPIAPLCFALFCSSKAPEKAGFFCASRNSRAAAAIRAGFLALVPDLQDLFAPGPCQIDLGPWGLGVPDSTTFLATADCGFNLKVKHGKTW